MCASKKRVIPNFNTWLFLGNPPKKHPSSTPRHWHHKEMVPAVLASSPWFSQTFAAESHPKVGESFRDSPCYGLYMYYNYSLVCVILMVRVGFYLIHNHSDFLIIERI